uniref:WD_REPEATS_REGION domain-containing protein n=1 Tax=Anopheles dirus TaxID=7168 RepID=A0A182MZC8_9DIPT
MGNIVERNRILENMSNLDGDDGGAGAGGEFGAEWQRTLRDQLFNDFQLQDEDDNMQEIEFASILRHLIRSGEIMVLNYESFLQHPLPVIRKKPKLDKLKQNDIYHSTKSASGQQEEMALGSGKPPGAAGAAGSFSLMNMVLARQHGLGKRKGPFMQSDLCKITNHFRPNAFSETVYSGDTKVFCGKFTSNGDRFVTASQDTLIRVYDSSRGQYKRLRTLETRHVSWSILDIDFSPDGSSFVYSTWADALFISSLDRDMSDNIHCLYLGPNNQNKLGVFTVCYSSCGKHILCGANDGSLYVYDLEANRRTLMAPVARGDMDVNSVGFVDELSNIFFSGSDDGIIKLWDRRCMNETNPEAVGRLTGHFDGITYIDSRSDGRYIISNSKDQSIKLWDLRKMSPSNARREYVHINWDYRWDDVPRRYFNPSKPLRGDTSIMTYRGHKVQKSLIRAKFSPASTTGQRYIYTGCGTGRLIIYDVLTGSIVEAIEGHQDIVRDVAWHPHRAEILTCSWDCSVHRHTYCSPIEQQEHRERMLELKTRLQSRRPEDGTSDGDDTEPRTVNQPIRRSRRLAERNNTGSGVSSNSGSNSSSNSSLGEAGASTRRRSIRSSVSNSSSSNSSRSRSTSSGRTSRNSSLSSSSNPLVSLQSEWRMLRRRHHRSP